MLHVIGKAHHCVRRPAAAKQLYCTPSQPSASVAVSMRRGLCRVSCSSVKPHLDPVVFPHSDVVTLEGSKRQVPREQVIDLLADSITPERLSKLQQVIKARSYSVVPVVEGLYDMGNLAAVCRSADAFGFGAVHCIMSALDKYKRSQRTAAGADKWLDMRLWDDTKQCLTALKGAGYQVVVTSLQQHSVTIQEVDWTRPTAFVLGNERQGVSDTAVQLADATAVIPMAGFVESFNISVAAALIMYEAQQQRIRHYGQAGDLTPQQQEQLLAAFLLRGVKNSSMVATELLNRPPPAHQQRFFKQPPGDAGDTEPAAAAAADQVPGTRPGRQAGQQSTLPASAPDIAAPAA